MIVFQNERANKRVQRIGHKPGLPLTRGVGRHNEPCKEQRDMKDQRKRLHVKQDYVQALGLAAYAFASCEWQVVWCCEKIRPGSVKKIVSDEMTAGKIARYFLNVSRNIPKSKEREKLLRLAETFADLVNERNNILHGKPCTGPNGETRLSGRGVIEIADLEEAADAFAECGGKLNVLFYSFLSTYVPQ